MGASQIMNFSVLNEWIYLLSTRVLSSVFDTQVIGFKASSIFKDSSKTCFLWREGGGGGVVYL